MVNWMSFVLVTVVTADAVYLGTVWSSLLKGVPLLRMKGSDIDISGKHN